MATLKVYDMEINDNDETGVDINSFVSKPAHVRSFEVYGRMKERYKINEEKRMVTGVFILADTLIYRNDEQLGEHYVKFSPAVIERIRNKFFKQGYNTNTNVEHSVNVSDAILVESYIVDSENPRAAGVPVILAKQNVTNGSWVGSYYIENEALWRDCKNGTFTGFSVEGFFDKVESKTKTKNSTMSDKAKKKNGFFKAIFGEDETFAEVTTVDGTVLTYEGELKEGTILLDKDGKAPTAGDHQIEMDDKVYAITTDKTGAIISMEEVQAMSESEEALAAAVKKVKDDSLAAFKKQQSIIEDQDKRLKAMEAYLSAKDSKFSAFSGTKKTGANGDKKPAWRK